MTFDACHDLLMALRAGARGQHDDLSIMDEAADEIDRLRAENARLLSLMAKANAVMRETGWQLAPASTDAEDEGVLELAAAEIESEFADTLSASQRMGA